jgi:hypothetical protein
MPRKRLGYIALITAFTSTVAIANGGQQVVVGLWQGMTIKTSNSWANVEVRAMSFGPGFCATHITVGDKTVAIAAPPATYSGWVTANSHGGSVNFSISKDDKCDTGTQAQVRYWRD